ncbi:hypothetical protein J437_LFUL016249, partial [Ladona fulva]
MINIEKRGKLKTKPKVVVDYNDTMGGVDRVDQHLADYPIPRKRGKKYYKIYFFIQWSWLSGILLFATRRREGGKCTLTNFPSIASPKVGRPPTTPHPRHLTEKHLLERDPHSEKKINVSKQCFMFSLTKKRDAKGKKSVRKQDTTIQIVMLHCALHHVFPITIQKQISNVII